jgi:hypothetical protein
MKYALIGVSLLLIIGIGIYVAQPTEPEPEQPIREDVVRESDSPAPTEEETASLPAADLPEDDPAVSGLNEELPMAETSMEAGFVDGSYTVEASYFTPRRTEHLMDITLTLENGIVTDASIIWDGDVTPKTPNHIAFDEAYKAEVVGQPINEIYLSRVGGASLTSEAFNEAVQEIQTEASAS